MTWSRFDPRVTDIHTFLIVALAHSGHGHLAHWEYTHPECVPDSIDEYSKTESGEFNVSAYQQDGMYPIKYSMVVNDRTYQFSLHEGPNGSDERYDVAVITDLMNTIAVRQKLKRRFFIFESLEKGYCLVMHLDPETARKLDSKFLLSPGRGTKYYLDY